MSPSTTTNRYEEMAMFGLEKIERAGLDAYSALNAFVIFQDRDTVFYNNRFLLAVFNTRTTSGT
jgi:hypothetical protein